VAHLTRENSKLLRLAERRWRRHGGEVTGQHSSDFLSLTGNQVLFDVLTYLVFINRDQITLHYIT